MQFVSAQTAKITTSVDMYGATTNYCVLNRSPSNVEKNALIDDIMNASTSSGMKFLISKCSNHLTDKSEEDLDIPKVSKILEQSFSHPDYFSVDNFLAYMLVTDNMKERVAHITQNQASNPLWHMARDKRLTSSKFGLILRAKKYTEPLINSIITNRDLSKVKAIEWGVNKEDEAIKTFSKITGLQVEKTGIWLSKSGLLGASPDGFIGNDFILEVKCPYSKRDQILRNGLSKDFFLIEIDNILHLKSNHLYYHQIQGQLHLTGRKLCYLVVWTTKDCEILKIKKDPQWTTNINVLEQFYKWHILPLIANSASKSKKGIIVIENETQEYASVTHSISSV